MSDTKKLVTILVVKDDQTKSMHISTSLVSLIKPVITFICVLIPALIAIILYLVGQHMVSNQHSDENLVLKNQLAELKDAKSKEVEERLAVLKSTEESIAQLEHYLKDRGVNIQPVFAVPANNQPNDAAGGPLNEEETIFLSETTQEEITSLFAAIRKIPIGYPHRGKISSYFGSRSNPFTGSGSEKHGGIDFKGKSGDAIKATADGKIIHAGSRGGYGNLVQIKHQYGYSTYYAHLSAVKVKVGQKVKAGDIIGELGSTGRSTGPHLHYEVRKSEERVDPVEFLSLK